MKTSSLSMPGSKYIGAFITPPFFFNIFLISPCERRKTCVYYVLLRLIAKRFFVRFHEIFRSMTFGKMLKTGSKMLKKKFFEKKIEFFIKKCWTVCILLTILSALFVLSTDLRGDKQEGAKAEIKKNLSAEDIKALKEETLYLRGENAGLKKENESLRKELIEILERYSEQDASMERIQLSIAGALATSEKTDVSVKEQELLSVMERLLKHSGTYAFKSLEFYRQLEDVLKKAQLDSVELAKIKLAMEDLAGKAKDLGAMSTSPQQIQRVDRCRVLAINKSLQTVVLSAGFAQGITNGLNWYAGKNREIQLRVVTARPFISAAAVIKGNINDLSQGMPVYSSAK